MSKKPSLAELRQQFKNKAEGKKEFTGNSEVYPHWNIAEGATATVRILPDKNEDNSNYFYIDKLEHKLSIEGKDRKIPCMKMYGEKCPICELSSKYYKAEGKDSVQGKYYYFKRTSLMKALILKDGIDYSAGGESAKGQVKTLQFTFQLMKVINAAIASEAEGKALEELPWDMDAGYNFIIEKTKQGQHDNYSTSCFANKQTGIAEEYLDVVEEGRVDLKTLLPANPGLAKVQALLEQHLGNADADEDEDEDEAPVISKRKQAEDEDELPKRKRPVDEDEDEAPAPKRKRVVEEEEEEEEEAPVIKRKRVVEEEEEEAPAPKRKRVVVEEEEEEAPVVKKKKPVVEADDEDEEDSEIISRIRARKRNAE